MAPQGFGSCSITLQQGLKAPRAARAELASCLAGVPGRVRQDALIAVTELVANAVRFGRPPIRVNAALAGDSLVVEVSDEGSDRPRRRVPAEDDGVGLNLVYLLADRVDIAEDRSRVRCEFALHHGSG